MDIQLGVGVPELTAKAEVALLCRTLAREGYFDNIAGHITYAQPDGTLLVNPFELLWDEVCAGDIMRIDKEGKILAGKWSVTPAILLHLEMHRLRGDAAVAIHNHPRWGTIWANVGRVPPAYEQTSAYIGSRIALVDDYDGGVDVAANARAVAEAVGDQACALLRNHGVLVVGQTIRQAHMRAVSLETRARIAWHVETLGNGIAMRPEVVEQLGGIVDRPSVDSMPHLWDAYVRRELRADPSILD